MKLLLLLLISPLVLFAQTSHDSSFRFYYYDQKLSFFEAMPSQKREVIWMGDSITDGGEWSELFPSKKTLNRGISADNSFGVLNRLYEVIKRKPKKIFLLIGINDIARGIPDTVIIKNYRKIIDSVQMQTPATILYVQSILPTNNNYSDFIKHQNKEAHVKLINAELEKLCNKKNVVYVDLHSGFTDEQGKLDKRFTNDGLHLTGEGYKNWKALLLKKKLM
jgi:lysophospholipase L1-like esterase